MAEQSHTRPDRWAGEAGAGDVWQHRGHRITSEIAIEYRAPASRLTTPQIVCELLWLDDAPTWPGAIGDHARRRRDDLRSELARREGRS